MREREKATNNSNKWLINVYLTESERHTHAALVNASPWAAYKTTLVKSEGKKIKISCSTVNMLGSVLLKSVLLNG